MTQGQDPSEAPGEPPADPAAVLDALEERVFADNPELREASERKTPAPDAQDPGNDAPV